MSQNYQPKRGAIAAGHPLTAAAGAQMLKQGGNAVDAAVAAAFATFISEYTLSAPGGGGFALVYDAAGGQSQLLDFFSTGPGLGRATQPSPQDIDFQEITVDYGPSRQHFYVGRGAVAVPGNVAGLCSLAKQAGRLPLPVLLEPAIRLAKEGCPVSEIQAFIGGLIEPILLLTPECVAIFGRPEGGLRPAGDLVRMPALADTLEALGREGPGLFYRGDVARAIVADQQAHGGLLTAMDLERYRVRRYRPLASRFRQYDVLTNPPPSRGGLLITFTLRLLDGFSLETLAFGSPGHLELLAEAMRVTHLARRELEANELLPRQQTARLLGPATVARWQGTLRDLLARPVAARALDAAPPAMPNTTQISVMDEDGLVVSLTTSGGEGNGFVVPGTGVILNNMLGEADLHPQGFHKSPPGQRIPSMMAPTVVLRDGAPVLALGSGGANRIRSAIVQVLLNRLAVQLPLDQAVAVARIHFEEGVIQAEGGNDSSAIDALEAAGYTVNRWQTRHMFFGGAHAVARQPDGSFAAVGDPRRGGAAILVTGDRSSANPFTVHRLPMTVPCTRCPSLVANRRRIVHGYGDPRARLMIVGEAPGYLGADRTGVPFTGDRSGRRVQALLMRLGLSEESDLAVETPTLRDVYLTNVVRCNPPGNRNPTPVEVANCAPYLAAELAAVRPRIVATLGIFAAQWAFQALLGQEMPAGIRELHGRVWPAGDVTLLTLVHPARASNAQMATAETALQGLLCQAV